jgi:tRNA A-37 threonylcarbamoyl transferase component Bud32
MDSRLEEAVTHPDIALTIDETGTEEEIEEALAEFEPVDQFRGGIKVTSGWLVLTEDDYYHIFGDGMWKSYLRSDIRSAIYNEKRIFPNKLEVFFDEGMKSYGAKKQSGETFAEVLCNENISHVAEVCIDDIDSIEDEEQQPITESAKDDSAAAEGNQKQSQVPQVESEYRPAIELPSDSDRSVEYSDFDDKQLIGTGGNADVYRATVLLEDTQMDLAVKEPRTKGTLHTDIVERLLNEAGKWQNIDSHEHIVDVVDFGNKPLPWIAMECMDGGDLGDRAGTMEFDQALWTAIATTKAVRHAHRHGIAHLDLKPENILFRSVEDGWDVPKVADWGLSKYLLDHSNTVEGLSPQYAAPEQFDEEYGSTDDITDIYQLGAVFYELFTGDPPFNGKPFKIIGKVKDESPTQPSDIADVPNELDDILLTALAKQKDDRYEDILYFRDDLEDLFDSVNTSNDPY